MATFNNLSDVRNEMNLLMKQVDETSFLEVIRQTLAEFEYQGLNVLGIVKEIYRRGMAGERSRGDVQLDIKYMILLFLARGNNVEKMILRTNDTGKAKINLLKQTYTLANKVGRGGNTVITLSRVASVFPMVTLRILANPEVNVPRAVALPAADFGEQFPRAMQTVIAAAIFPRGEVGTRLMKALLLYLIEENKLLSNDGAPDMDILRRILPFARASFVSSIINEADRPGACHSVALVTDVAATDVVGSLQVAIATFTRKYPQVDLGFIA